MTYTQFDLRIEGLDPQSARAIALEQEISRIEGAFEEIDVETGCSGFTTWYDWQSDMSLLSSRFPELTFVLYGENEDDKEPWVAYFKNGRMQFGYAEVVYPTFDQNKLEFVDREDTYSSEFWA